MVDLARISHHGEMMRGGAVENASREASGLCRRPSLANMHMLVCSFGGRVGTRTVDENDAAVSRTVPNTPVPITTGDSGDRRGLE